MDQGAGQPYPDQHTRVRSMGRGPGIRVVSKDSIQIDFRWRGKRCRERLRLAPTKENKRFAQRLKAVIEHEIATGTFDYAKHFPKSKRARVSVGVPLLQSMLAFIDSLDSELEPETLRKYRLDAATVAGWFPGESLKTLKRAKVRDVIAILPLSKKRILNLLTPLRGAISQAVEDEDLPRNPLEDLKIRRRRSPNDERPQPFTPAEVTALGRAQLGELWTSWAWTGLRPGEVIGLQAGDVDLESGRIRVRRAVRVGRTKSPKTKSGERSVDLLPAARKALAFVAQLAPGEPVFRNPNTGERWHEDRALARAFRKACAEAGVRYRPPKHLRHTYASWALSSGENPLWVAEQMGHEDTTMIFRVYAEWIPQADLMAGSRMVSKAGGAA
jgi:integrase